MSKKEELTGKYYMGINQEKINNTRKSGADAAEKLFGVNPSKLIIPKNDIEIMAEQMRDEKEAKSTFEKLFEIEKAKQDEIDAKIEKLELIPMRSNVLILPYPSNPYRKIIDKETGIYFPENKYYKNPDTGEMDEQKLGIGCAKVVEVGPECKYVAIGDDIYYDTRTVVPIPFYGNPYKLLTEPQILCVLNENLKERFNMK